MYTPEEMKIIHEEVTRLRKEGSKPDPMLDKNSEEFKNSGKWAWRIMGIGLAIYLPIAGFMIYSLTEDDLRQVVNLLASPKLTLICVSIFTVSLVVSLVFRGGVWFFNNITYLFGALSIISLINDMAMRVFL